MTTSTKKHLQGEKGEQGEDTGEAVNWQAEPGGKDLHLHLICQGFTLVKL